MRIHNRSFEKSIPVLSYMFRAEYVSRWHTGLREQGMGTHLNCLIFIKIEQFTHQACCWHRLCSLYFQVHLAMRRFSCNVTV